MAKLSIYLPDPLAKRVRERQLNLSQIARHALEEALEVATGCDHAVVECASCRVRLRRPDDLEPADSGA